MDFMSGVAWRSSQRGLVVCGAGGSSLLIEHERAAELPALLDDASDADELAALLGGSDVDHQVVADLVAERIVADPTMPVANRTSSLRSGWCLPARVWSSPASTVSPERCTAS